MIFKFNLNNFWKNVIKLSSGTIFAQFIGFMVGPIITRIYSPEMYGVWGIFNAVSGTIVIISTLRYERAIVISSKEEAKHLLLLCFIISSIISLITFFIFFVFQNNLSRLLKIDESNIVLFIPFFILITSLYNSLSSYSNSIKFYKQLSLTVILITIFSSLSKIILPIFFNKSSTLLIFSDIIGLIMGNLFLFFSILKFLECNESVKLSILIKKYINFPKYDIFTSFINNISWMLPNFLLAYFFSTREVGFYNLGFSMLRVPMNLIGKSVGDVYYKQSSEYASDNQLLKNITISTLKNLFLLSIIPTVLLQFLGQEIFMIIFGIKWSEAGVYSEILSFWTLVWFLSSPISNLYYVLGLQKDFLLLMIFNLALRSISLVIGAYFKSIYLSLILFSLSGILVYGYQIIFLTSKIGIKKNDLWETSILSLKLGVILSIVFLLIKLISLNLIVKVILSFIISGIAYLFLFKRS